MQKRLDLYVLGVVALGLPVLTRDLVRRLVALFTHPLTRKRDPMCIFGWIFKWITEDEGPKICRLPFDAPDELGIAVCCMP